MLTSELGRVKALAYKGEKSKRVFLSLFIQYHIEQKSAWCRWGTNLSSSAEWNSDRLILSAPIWEFRASQTLLCPDQSMTGFTKNVATMSEDGYDRHSEKWRSRGGAGWVDPNYDERWKYYGLRQRHLYMVALAHLENAIPKEVMRAMDDQKYPAVWDGQYRDLCSLIMVVQKFMHDVLE